ncbi:MAG: TetR/AcrR family transcriptional regulator, partial [Thermoanaerobaculia bacterium]
MELDAPRTDTRESLLDAAERRFAADGVEGASLRSITREAGANLAAVHYYFGSKEGLAEAVFARRLAPLGAERLRRLEACRQDGPPSLECVLRAFVEPVVHAGGGVSREFGRLMCRCVAEREGVVRDVLARELRETFESFVEALAEALP